MEPVHNEFRKYLDSDDKVYAFVKWAFGDKEQRKNLTGKLDFLHAWNRLHPEFKFSSSGRPVDDMPKMVDYWKNR